MSGPRSTSSTWKAWSTWSGRSPACASARRCRTAPSVRADEIELIDITPAELRERLAEGKVYVPETARLAAERFFKVENLTALRELALRRAAQTVDDQLIHAMKVAGVEGPWAAGERILVLVAPDAMRGCAGPGRPAALGHDDGRAVDGGPRRASQHRPALASAAAQKLREALKLAEQLGGSTVALTGDDLVAVGARLRRPQQHHPDRRRQVAGAAGAIPSAAT